MDQAAAMREKKKNKKNDKKKGKVRIIVDVMTREQDSDSTSLPGGRGQRVEMSPPQQPNRWKDMRDPSHNKYVPRTVTFPREIICSFCGVATHGHKDCPVMHQYIREQADALARRRLEEYHQLQAWEEYESPKQVPSGQDPQQRGGGPHETESISGQRLPGWETQRQRSSAKVGIVESMYPHVVKGMAPGVGGSPSPPGQGDPQKINQMRDQMKKRIRRVIQMRKLYQ